MYPPPGAALGLMGSVLAVERLYRFERARQLPYATIVDSLCKVEYPTHEARTCLISTIGWRLETEGLGARAICPEIAYFFLMRTGGRINL